jgi:hypothetical protein
MAGSWDDIHWVKTSADIPRNDFLNFTVEELCGRYPKVSREDILLERHVRFPRRFPMPPGQSPQDLKYRKNLIVRGLGDLKDSIFAELAAEEIRKRYPQFGFEDIRREQILRQLREIKARMMKNLRMPDSRSKEKVSVDLGQAEDRLKSAAPLAGELIELRDYFAGVRSNMRA